MRVVETLAQADGSAAWVTFIAATSGTVLAYLPPESAREIFFRPDVMLAGVFAPRGKALAEDGGFRVTGRWQWGSGTQNADWVMGGCQVVRDGVGETLPSGAPRSRMMLAAADEVEFFDTWQVSGLCGTGSTDFAMNDIFVAQARAVGLVDGRPIEAPLYAFPQFGLLAMGIAAVTLGLARAAIDDLVALAGHEGAVRQRALTRHAAEQPERCRLGGGRTALRARLLLRLDRECLAFGSERRRDSSRRAAGSSSRHHACGTGEREGGRPDVPPRRWHIGIPTITIAAHLPRRPRRHAAHDGGAGRSRADREAVPGARKRTPRCCDGSARMLAALMGWQL